jgi:RecA/RadA recombinase
MPRVSVASAKDAKLKELQSVAKAFKGFRPASDVLKRVRAVPTRFPQLDFATRVGGLPIERFMLLHGPSNEGKTALCLGLEESFLALDHAVEHVDAERTTPITWVEELMGELARHPLFFADRPKDYETTIARVREFLNRLIALNRKAKRPMSALVVVDSLRKLVPADVMKEILTADKEDGERLGRQGKKITAGRDRRAQLQAKMNAAWMDEVVPLLDESGAAFVAIAREMQDPDADPWARKFGNDYKVGGGGAIYYDASLSMRVQRAGWVDNGAKERGQLVVYGERHRITIKKTKVGGKDAKVSTAYFHTSNGKLEGVPFGFDRARDVLELARRFDVVKNPKGNWLTWGASRWQGEHRAVQRLTAEPPTLARMEREVRERFADHKPVEHDEDTGEVGE